MTRQESPSTLLHFGEHWWPLDRQPKTFYQHHQHRPTTTTNITTTPPKPRPRKGRKQHKQLQSTKGLMEAARYNRKPLNLNLLPSSYLWICDWTSCSEASFHWVWKGSHVFFVVVIHSQMSNLKNIFFYVRNNKRSNEIKIQTRSQWSSGLWWSSTISQWIRHIYNLSKINFPYV